MEDIHLEEVCRLCLTKHNDMQLAIEIGATERLMDCVSVQLPSDSLICAFCKEEVNKWYSFKQQVLRSLEVAKYIEKRRKESSVSRENYGDIEECYIKTEVENIYEEVEVKPDISQIGNLMCQEQPELLQNEEDINFTPGISNLQLNKPASKKTAYKCNYCDKTLQTLTGLMNHNNRYHNKESPESTEDPSRREENKYQCDLCHKSFISKMGMVWHKQLHTALKLDSSKSTTLFTCPQCPMSYEKKLSLIDHMKWKHDMKRIINQINFCDLCGKYCQTKADFRGHMKTHKNEKFITYQKLSSVFSCPICRRNFMSRSGLHTHQASHERTYTCHTCNKSFGSRYNLKRHAESH